MESNPYDVVTNGSAAGRVIMSKSAERIFTRMKKAADEDGWTVVPAYSPTVRYTKTRPTPEHARKRGVYGGQPMYDFDTYDTHVFVTLVGSKVILGVGAAPWVRRQDYDVPHWLALAILDDPTLAFDHPRQRQMKADRHA